MFQGANWVERKSITGSKMSPKSPKEQSILRSKVFVSISICTMYCLKDAITDWLRFFTGSKKLITGPSDFGAPCPSPSYNEYRQSGKNYCCCRDGCCWDKCVSSQPPVDCLQGYGITGFLVSRPGIQN